MATENSIDSNIAIEISKGGTNNTNMSVSYGTVFYDSSSLITVSSVGGSGQVLTSNGAAAAPTFQTGGGGGGGAGISSFLATLNTNKINVTGDNSPTYYRVPFNTEIYDAGGDYDTSTGAFTAPQTGKYLYAVSITSDDSSDWYSVSAGIETSNVGYILNRGSAKWSNDSRNASAGGSYQGNYTINYSNIADSDSADVTYGVIMATNSNIGSNTVDVIGDVEMTYFGGALIG